MEASLTTQVRVIAALVLRETRATFGTSQIGYLWAIIVPAAGTMLLVLLFSAVGRHPPFGASLALFFATGILTLEFFNKLSASLMTAFEANRALMAYPLLKGADFLFARATLIGATYALIMGLFFCTLIALDMAGPPAHPMALMEAFAVTLIFGFGFGATNAVIVSLLDSWRHVEKILTRPLIFISGVFYVPSALPASAREWVAWNPVLHAIEWLRNGYYANYDSRVLDKTYLVGIALCLVFTGLAGERLTRSRRN
ncbi:MULTISPECIES: ABC transporter permease [Chelativorans]|jgi:capsular polysaccharide transport system permease protein|uniref:ABC-2 type transporter n=1 Tax=Chelativorans sp. (strain BNC1) TaxID=266779 RepID=Q11EP1_CHESB|nr:MULTISPECIES: ABC transporter permease [Chelativorans]